MSALYDKIGINYSKLRKPDPRIAAAIRGPLDSAKTILNVGAGTGAYEPEDRSVTAVEPSIKMIRQRSKFSAPVLQGCAENLPFDDDSFDASMAILTVHHWTDKEKGLKELRRVTRGQIIIVTYDPLFRGFWLTDYIPELIDLDEAQMPKLTNFEAWLGPIKVTPVAIPHDCSDGFLCAYWRRPAAYLDPQIRSAISPFHALGDISGSLEKLADDLKSGEWNRKYSKFLELEDCDLGYRLFVTA